MVTVHTVFGAAAAAGDAINASHATQAARDVGRVSILNAELAKASASAAAGSESAADDVEAVADFVLTLD